SPGSSPFYFVDATPASGITFRHSDGSQGRHHTIETYASGLCIFDYDGDGDDDIYFLSARPIEGPPPARPPRNALYRNDGDWRFTDVTEKAGVGDEGFGLGVSAGDYDGDGDLDLYVTNYGPNVLYRNEGDGTFTDVTRSAGVGDPFCGAGCAFLDIDRDGDLDLYVANYIDFSLEVSAPDYRGGVPFYRPPERFRPLPDILYRNEGGGTFRDASRETGIAAHVSYGMGMIAADYDDDGDTDIFVANDVSANFLWRNDGTGKFEEVAVESGVAFDCHGDEQGSMGVDAADFDGDGLLDFYQTSYASQMPSTYRNLGRGRFREVTLAAGTGQNQLGKVTWGCNFGDFDNDGHPDIFVAVGHVQDMIDRVSTTQRYKETNLIYHNDGTGRFREVAPWSGPGFAVAEASRGSGVSDLDGDGRLDIVVLNARSLPTLLRNETRNDNRWIEVALRGTKSNRQGVGARVRLKAGGRIQVAEAHAGRSYQSHYGGRLHFGLGANSTVERLEVRWPSGVVDVLQGLEANRVVTVVEGASPEGSAERAPSAPARSDQASSTTESPSALANSTSGSFTSP
ncbi:MAG: CRTAC1 family protein, partial [Planctomycetota bacterium]